MSDWQQIEDNIRWEKIQSMMKLTNWTWMILGRGLIVPEISDLKETAKRLVDEVSLMPIHSVHGTGGFEARKTKNGVCLSFVFDEWGSYEATQ